jgi:hypothetical protein
MLAETEIGDSYPVLGIGRVMTQIRRSTNTEMSIAGFAQLRPSGILEHPGAQPEVQINKAASTASALVHISAAENVVQCTRRPFLNDWTAYVSCRSGRNPPPFPHGKEVAR